MIIGQNIKHLSFKSNFIVDASRIGKDNKKEMKEAIELAEKERDQTVLNLVKDTLYDGKNDNYKLIYGNEQNGMLYLPSVQLFKNNILISKKSGNCDRKELTNEIWRDMAYNNLSDTQKNEFKTDFEKVKKHLIGCYDDGVKNDSVSYPNIFDKKINESPIKSYDGSYEKDAGLSLHPGYHNEDIGLFKSGGYIIAPIDTPISTVGMYECAALYIPDKANGKHFLWHVDKGTSVEKIAENIKKNNLPTDKIWIAEGCAPQTEETMRKIIEAIESINEDAKFAMITPSRDEQEVIGYKGELFGSRKKTNVSFNTTKTEYSL